MTGLTKNEQVTLDSYNRTARSWSKDHSTKKFWGDNFDYFHELLPRGRILEIGCGSGRDAQELIAMGYDYMGVDIAQNLLDEARKNNSHGQFEEMSIYDMKFDEPFDGFWCTAVLIHLPKERIDEALRAIARNVKAKAVGFITVKEGAGERLEQRPELDNAEFLFTYYQDEEFREILTRNGFETLKKGDMPMSERTKWLTYHVRSE